MKSPKPLDESHILIAIKPLKARSHPGKPLIEMEELPKIIRCHDCNKPMDIDDAIPYAVILGEHLVFTFYCEICVWQFYHPPESEDE